MKQQNKTLNVYGKNPLRELLKGTRHIHAIYTYQPLDDEFKNLITAHNIEVRQLTKQNFIKNYGDKTGGIVTVVDEYQYYPLNDLLNDVKAKEEAIILILANIEDPHNLGAILRSADATSIDGIIIPKDRSVGLNETVAKVSTGAIEHVKVSQVVNLNQTIELLKEANFWVIGLELSGTMDFKDAPYDGKIALVVGSEGKGIPRMVLNNCDLVVKIPMYGKVNSLNASVSAGLFLYEAIRHRVK